MAEQEPQAGPVYDDSDEEDEIFCDPDNDPSVIRKVFELEGQEMEEDEEGEMDDEEEGGMALRPDGFSDGREGEGESEAPVVDMSSARLEGHTDAVYAVAVHPGASELIATGGGDDTAGLWNRESKQRLFSLSGHTDSVIGVAFNVAGTMLATAGMDGVVKIWNPVDGSLLRTLEGPSEDIMWISWHSKGDVLIAGSTDMSVWMWNAGTGDCMSVFSGHSGSVTCGKFSQDGKLVMTASEDGSARVWSPKNGSCLINLADAKGAGTFHQAGINCLDTFGELLVTGSQDCTAIVTMISIPSSADVLPTAKVLFIHKHHQDSVEGVAISPTLGYVATASLDARVMVYEPSADSPRFTCLHDAGVTKVLWHPTKDWLVSSSLDRTVRVWDGKSGAGLVSWTGHKDAVMDVTVSSCGRHCVSASDDQCALVWSFPA